MMKTSLRKILPVLPLLLFCGRLMAEPGAATQVDPSLEQGSEARTADEAATAADPCEQVPAQDKLPEKMQSGVHEFS